MQEKVTPEKKTEPVKSQPGVQPGPEKEDSRKATPRDHTSQRFGGNIDESKNIRNEDLEDTEEPGDEASP